MRKGILFYARVVIVVALVLTAILSFTLSQGSAPSAPATSAVYGTIVGYDETTTKHHVTRINLFDKPAGAPAPYHVVGYAEEGQRVIVIEQHSDETIRIRTPGGIEGWTQAEFVTNIRP
jgi:hypothetical protein